MAMWVNMTKILSTIIAAGKRKEAQEAKLMLSPFTKKTL